MASIFLVGSKSKALEYLSGYAVQKNIADYNIERIDGVRVEDVREIKKKLSFRSFGDRIFFLTGEITLEAQNALLKSVEEHSPTTHFIFSEEKEDDLLPTIRSRCFVVRLEKEALASQEIERLVALYYSKDICDWNILEKMIDELSNVEPGLLISYMRNQMIADLDNTKNIIRLYDSCKKMLFLLPLINKNNLSVRTFVERALIGDET